MSDNWKDIFGSEPSDDTDEINDGVHKMTDEELEAYLQSIETPESVEDNSSEAGFSDTMISDWLPPVGEINSVNDSGTISDDTNVIPNDVKSISEATKSSRRMQMPETEPGKTETPEGAYEGRDYRLVRRRRNRRLGCMGGFMYFAFIIGISIILASLLWLAASDVLALNKKEISATIEIPDDFEMNEVIDELKEKGIIEYKFLFRIFAKISEAETKIDPGTYQLSTKYDYRAIVAKLQEGADSMMIVEVTIPEGKSLKQTFEILEENRVCKTSELWEAAANYDFSYDFLSSSTLGDEMRLEGFLFPDTYEFYVDSSPQYVIDKFLSNFDNRVTDVMYNQAELRGMTMHEVVTVASLIEMEAGNNQERPTIASVIYNRLASDYSYLEIDATIQYVLEERKAYLTNQDLLIDSPYNTYLNKGLPPGPIANPGIASIKAALEPEETDYFYYALNKENTHNFFNNYADFEVFVKSDEFGG
ncbi:MAG: endolytic transglycosylase MltG [Clostridiales bacterium]|nr:endolytic transglycosylase MltG [Clostridiales bacterium]